MEKKNIFRIPARVLKATGEREINSGRAAAQNSRSVRAVEILYVAHISA